MRCRLGVLSAALLLALAAPRAAQAWSHQGHILLTRLACLRIINDPAAPEPLKAFLKANMKYDMDACKRLATEDMVGEDPKNYRVGIDGAATLPDRIIYDPNEGDKIIAPYGVTEAKLHFIDMEYFAKTPVHKEDLSSRPAINDFPKDVKDPRYKLSGFLPFRVAESQDTLAAEFAKPKLDNDKAVERLGYLAHYLEDCTQPQHATIDYKSFSYLAGKVPAVHTATTQDALGNSLTVYRLTPKSAKVNPHGDLEFQLFENAEEPRKTFRAEYWKELTAQIDSLAKRPDKLVPVTDEFTHALGILSDSYACLPAVGHAAQAAYADGKFDAKAFFSHQDTVGGEKLTIIQIIARRNAAAVLEVEAGIRRAWATAHK